MSTDLEVESPADHTDKPDETPSSTLLGGDAPESDASEDTPTEPVVPESYELELPEGSVVPDGYIEQVAEYAKELGLSQDQASALVARDKSLIDAVQEQHANKMDAQIESWADEYRKEVGDKFDESVKSALKARDRFGDEALATMLEETGLGNHPAVIRFFSAVGKAITEDSYIPATKKPEPKKTLQEHLYGTRSE